MSPYKIRNAAWSAMQENITIGKIYLAAQRNLINVIFKRKFTKTS